MDVRRTISVSLTYFSLPVGFIVGYISDVLPQNSSFLELTQATASKDDFPQLFSVLGNTYGETTTNSTEFLLPDLGARNPVGTNSSLGQQGGEDTHLLSIQEMPTHNRRKYCAFNFRYNCGDA